MGVFVCAQVVPILCPSCAHADLGDHDCDHWVDLANFTAMTDSSRLIADAGLVFTNVCFHTEAAIRNKICIAIAYLHDNLTDVPSVSGLAD